MPTLELQADFIIRLAALPLGDVEGMAEHPVQVFCEEYLRLRATLMRERHDISALLHGLIGEDGNEAYRAPLLALRRNSYNLRRPRPDDLEVIKGRLLGQRLITYQKWRADLWRLWDLRSRIDKGVADQELLARRQLWELASRDAVVDGLVLGESPLQDAVLPHTASGRAAEGKREKLERGLLKYVTRTAMKATPFGAFCRIAAGNFASCASPLQDATGGIPGLSWREAWAPGEGAPVLVLLNKAIWGALWQKLLGTAQAEELLELELNPTTTYTGTIWKFVVPHETGDRITSLDTSEGVEDIVSRVGCGVRTLDALVSALSPPPLTGSRMQAQAFVRMLVGSGLLRWRDPVPPQDAAWEEAVAKWGKGVGTGAAVALGELCGAAARLKHGFAGAPAVERRERLRTMRRIVNELSLGGEGPRLRDNVPLCYEDYAYSWRLGLPRCSRVEKLATAMGQFVELRRGVAAPREEMATMRHVFDALYSGAIEGVSLVHFFEDYYRHHLKAHLHSLHQAKRAGRHDGEQRNPFRLPLITAMYAHNAAVSTYLRERWAATPDAAELHVTSTDWPALPEELRAPPDHPQSFTMFPQLVFGPDGEVVRGIVPFGQTFLGFGKYFSRFLPILPQDVVQNMRHRYEGVVGASLAEIADDSDFNANLHPPILPRALTFRSEGAWDGVVVTPCARLVVKRSPSDPSALVLEDSADQSRVIPMDLGFLNPQRRPALFQFLSTFGPWSSSVLPLPVTLAPTAPSSGDRGHLTRRPRIVFDDVLVLARERWLVDADDIPFPRGRNEEGDAFRTMNEWRSDAGIPQKVYVRRAPWPKKGPYREEAPDPQEGGAAGCPTTGGDERTSDPGEVAGKDERPLPGADNPRGRGTPRKAHRYNPDDRKPQFIDFHNPLLVGLVGRYARRSPGEVLVIEEQYPSSEQAVQHGGKAYASEMVVHLEMPLANKRCRS